MNVKIFLLTVVTLTIFSINLHADTFGKVVDILNQTCAFSSCHNAETKVAGLDLSGDRTAIYEAIVNQSPENQVAVEKNHSHIMQTHRHIYRRLKHCLCLYPKKVTRYNWVLYF